MGPSARPDRLHSRDRQLRLEPGETPVMMGGTKIVHSTKSYVVSREAFAMTATVDVLAQAFKDAGTPFIVGHPGGESVELMEAARQRQMRFLLMKQEVAGAMLASTWGDITGSPGICMSPRGAGAPNMVNGVAHAFLDRSPLIAITDAYSRPTYETGLRQRINQLAIYEPIVKWSTTIDAKTVRQQVRRAIRTAIGAPPGPVHF